MNADRELRAEASVDGPAGPGLGAADRLLRRMPEWSPELVRMVPLKPGGLRVGQWYLGINRRKAVVWPTRSVVAVARARPRAGLGHHVQRRPVDLGARAAGR